MGSSHLPQEEIQPFGQIRSNSSLQPLIILTKLRTLIGVQMKSVEVCLLGVVLIVVGLVVPVARGIWLDVPSSGTKCVSEELHSKVVVLADFFVVGDEHHINNSIVPTISVKVNTPFCF